MNLEQQLKITGETWLGEERLSPAQSALLTKTIRQRGRRRKLQRWGAVAAGLLLVGTGGYYGPIVTSYASDLPWVGTYIQQMAGSDDGLVWAEGQGYVVPVGKSVTREGYTLTIDSILADGARTELFWSITGEGLEDEVRLKGLTYHYNLTENHGGWSSNLKHVDGKMIGRLSLPPLPHPVTVVTVELPEINGVKEDWSLSFTASRRALDSMTKVVKVNQPLKGEGYDLTVTQVTLAPTGTVVEVEGETEPGLEIREVSLGTGTRSHGSSVSYDYQGGRQQVSYRFEFDRLDPLPDSIAFQVTDLIQRREGGPELPLQLGAHTEWQGTRFTVDSMQVVEGQTEVLLKVTTDRSTKYLLDSFPRWNLQTADGEVIRSVHNSARGDGMAVMTLRFPGQPTEPVKLQAAQYADSLPLPPAILIPLQ